MKRRFEYPHSREATVVDLYHGTAVSDPFRWLEDPDSEETQVWSQAQDALTRTFLEELPGRDQLAKRFTSLYNYPKFGVPFRRGERIFFSQNDGLQNQSVLFWQANEAADPQELLDPNTLADDGTVALTGISVSKDGRYLSYNLSESGSDWQTIHVRDVTTGEDFDDRLEWCKFANVAWLSDGSGFFYSRYPAPGEMPDKPPSTHHRLYFHQLGTTQDDDRLIYARPDDKDLAFSPSITDDGRFLILFVFEGTDRRNRIYYRDLQGNDEVIRLLDDRDAKYQFIANNDTTFYFLTDLDAPRGRIIAIDVQQPERAKWQEIVPQGDDVIQFVTAVFDQLVVGQLHNAHSRLKRYGFDGASLGDIPLPTVGSIAAISGRRQDRHLYINFQSFLNPPTIFQFDMETAVLAPFREVSIDFDPTQYETTLHHAPSKDGTRVPVFLTHKKGLTLDGSHLTLLYGYGGFTVSMTPVFSSARLLWLEQGGVYAHAVLRGGNEFGEAWHEAGMLGKKQNVFDDFIGLAEWLIEAGYTNPKKLAIQGGSNGGLLVAACMLQRPELFGAVHCAVPVTDMLRYHKFTAGRYWVSEYGNAEEEEDAFHYLMAYSPLHNVKPDAAYPPLLITTADTDDRVVPMHAKKFAATLQANDKTGFQPLLIRIESKAGHGLGKPTAKIIEEQADVYAFLLNLLDRE